MSRLVPYLSSSDSLAQDNVEGGAKRVQADARLEAIAKFVPAEILAFYLPASGAATLAGPDLANGLQWITFLLGWAAVPAYFFWIAKGDDRGWRQIVVSSVAFPIWVMASKAFWPLGWWIPQNQGVALWLLALFTLISAFLLPKK